MARKINIKTADEIAAMKRSGKLLAAVFDMLRESLKPGLRSIDIDRKAENFIRERGGIPSFKGYRGYPGTLCISFNEQVVHGIPGDRKFEEGDLVGIDCGVILEEYHSDRAETFFIGGQPPLEIENLMNTTRAALEKGLSMWTPGNRIGDVSNSIQAVAEKEGYGVVRALVGHGIGREMHEDPQVPNFGKAGHGPEIVEGMTAAIEPMVNMGTYEVRTLRDGWTVVTADGMLSCHFEHTVAATAAGPEILTLP